MKHIDKLNCPPVVGEFYLVPCVFGKYTNIGRHNIPPQLWPVFLPSHEDSKYYPQYRTKWIETPTGQYTIEETYYESVPGTLHHYHVDPRFTPAEFYTEWEQVNKSWHNVIEAVDSDVKTEKLQCIREMPIQRLFTGFGQNFIDDHKNKKIVCGRCPHKKVNLKSVPIINGVITCPNHGLQFDSKTGNCLNK
jgi:nitrite reductase/ring-hydroxylating ferredoxin subunit